MTRVAHSNNIPLSVEYLGLGEWVVRWNVETEEIQNIDGIEDNVKHYKYNEQVLDHYPTQDEIEKIIAGGQCDDVQLQVTKFVKQVINSIAIPSAKALEIKVLYPIWGQGDAAFGTPVTKGFRFRVVKDDSDVLYEVIQDHTLQSNWEPGIYTASLYKVIDKEHAGTQEDPIPYIPPMELFNGKYYTQNDVLYLCTRDSGIPLTHDLSSLVNVYVTVVQ